MKNRLFIVSGALIFMLLVGGQERSCSQEQELTDEQKLELAIKDLQSSNKLARRTGAEKISLLVQTPGIQRAVKPLSDLLLDREKPSGIFTQGICAFNLGKIAARLKSGEAEKAIEALSESLATDEFEYVRASSAQALGHTQNKLAIAPLEEALAKDRSPFVRYATEKALRLLADSGVGASSSSKTVNTMSANEAVKTEGEEEQLLYDYLGDHIIYANPPIMPAGGGK